MGNDILHHHDAHLIELEGVENFRDIGGYRAENGRRVRWGRLFRSGHLAAMSQFDSEQLEPLGITTLFDLRTRQERSDFPTRWGNGASPEVVTIDLDEGNSERFDDLFEGIMSGDISRDQVLAHVLSDYSSMPYDFAPLLKSLFARLAEPDRGSIVIHCTAGKDRTGLVVALVMTLLGVPKEKINDDYMLSNEGFAGEQKLEHIAGLFKRKVKDIVARIDALRPIIVADQAYLDAAFAAIEMKEGSTAAYFEHVLGISATQIEGLKQSLLEPGRVAD